MSEPFITARRQIGFAQETSRYVAETLSVSDYNFRARDVTYSPEIEAFARKYATGNYSAFKSIMGKKKLTVTFTIDMAAGIGGGTTVPEWDEIVQSCGLAKTVLGAGLRWQNDTDKSSVPCTIEVQEMLANGDDAIVIKGKGMMGNVEFVVDNVGETLQARFSFEGVFVSIVDRGTALSATGFDTTEPDPVLDITATVFGEDQTLNSLSINQGNTIGMKTEPAGNTTGYEGAYITNRDAVCTMDPYMELIADRGNLARWSGGTTGALVVTVGSGATALSLKAPSFQIGPSAYSGADSDGFVRNPLEGILVKGASGDDELRLIQGVE